MNFLKNSDYWVLVGIFMTGWLILILTIFSIWENKYIERWEKAMIVYSDLPQLQRFDRVFEKYLCKKCIDHPEFLEFLKGRK